MRENTILMLIGAGTFIVALLTLLSLITNIFKKKIPLQFGFLVNDKVLDEIDVSSGDPKKPIFFRLKNISKSTLAGIVIDIRFMKPLALSGTNTALSFIPGKTIHGRTTDNSYYLIRYTELEMAGHANADFRVELNTENKSPGSYKIIVTAYSTQQDYNYKREEILVNIK